jgi:hypothetical protein
VRVRLPEGTGALAVGEFALLVRYLPNSQAGDAATALRPAV